MMLVLFLWDMLANPLMILGPIVLVVIAFRHYPRAAAGSQPTSPRPLSGAGWAAALTGFLLGAVAGAAAALAISMLVMPMLWMGGTEAHVARAWYRGLLLVIGTPGAAVGGFLGGAATARWWRIPEPSVRTPAGRRKLTLLGVATIWTVGIFCSSFFWTPETMSRRLNRSLERQAARSGELGAYRSIEEKEALAERDPVSALTSRDPYTRYHAAVKLSWNKDPRALPVLSEGAKDPTAGVAQSGPMSRDVIEAERTAIIEALGGYSDRAASDALLSVLSAEAANAPFDDRRRTILFHTLMAIGRAGDARAAPQLVQIARRAGLTAANPVSQTAAQALVKIAGRTGDPRAAAAVKEISRLPGGPRLLLDASSIEPEAHASSVAPIIRESAAIAYKSPITALNEGDAKTLRLLISRATGADTRDAAYGLAQLADDSVVPDLIADLRGPEPGAASYAARVLGETGDRRAVGPIRAARKEGRLGEDGPRALWQLFALRPDETPAGFVPGAPAAPKSCLFYKDRGWCHCLVYRGTAVGVLLDRRPKGRLGPACVALFRGRAGRLDGNSWVQDAGRPTENVHGRLDYGLGGNRTTLLWMVMRQAAVPGDEEIVIGDDRGQASAGRVLLIDVRTTGSPTVARVKVDPGFDAPSFDWDNRGNTLSRDLVAALARRNPQVRDFLARRRPEGKTSR